MPTAAPTVHLFFRKKRPNANHSIENSFRSMSEAFVRLSQLKLQDVHASYFSNGIINRVRAILEASKRQGDVNHIVGDIHFLTLGLEPQKTVLTIHDCGFMTLYKNPLQRAFLKLFWLTIPVRRSAIVTVVSEATKRDVMRYTGCSADKIRVIPTIIGDYFQRVPKTFNKAKPQILHLGLAPNKNLERHIKALRDLPCHLRVIGKLSDAHKRMLAENNVEYSYAFDISNAQIQQEYAKADLVLFASTLEGFGMPILEAQTVGRPVVTSNLSSMPEVAGDAACLVDPLSIDSIRAGVLRVIQDDDYRNALIEKGFDNIKRYQAETVARQYEAVYAEVLAAKG